MIHSEIYLNSLSTEELLNEFGKTDNVKQAKIIADILIKRKAERNRQRELASKRHKYERTSAKKLTALLEADSTDAEDKSIIAEILAERKKRATNGHSI